MSLLQSDWFIAMVKKSAAAPKLRMLNMFNIVDDWLGAPHTQTSTLADDNQTKLQDYLTEQASLAGAAMPTLLANQLYFMLLAAAQEQLTHQQSNSLTLARGAAEAMITAQTTSQPKSNKKIVFASVASLCVGVLLGSTFYFAPKLQPVATTAQVSTPDTIINAAQPDRHIIKTASPSQTAALFARIEQMRHGECRLLEALQLPDKYKAIYFENIVQGQISTKLEDQRIVHELLSKVRCNYKPMLMQNSRG